MRSVYGMKCADGKNLAQQHGQQNHPAQRSLSQVYISVQIVPVYALATLESSSTTFPVEAFNEPTLALDGDDEAKPEPPDVSYPGDDPAVPPADGFEWRGQEPVGSDKGSWVNPQTGEQYHPDLNHGDPVGPHYDYTNGAKPRT